MSLINQPGFSERNGPLNKLFIGFPIDIINWISDKVVSTTRGTAKNIFK